MMWIEISDDNCFCQQNAVPLSSATLKLLWYAVTVKQSYPSQQKDVLDSPSRVLLGERVIDDAVDGFLPSFNRPT